MFVSLDTATALSPARSVVVEAWPGSGKAPLPASPFDLAVQTTRTL